MKYSFVILNYKNSESTFKCVDNIIQKFDKNDIFIVIIDNGGDDYINITNKYQHTTMIKVLKTDTNLGFAKGNNLGYEYVRDFSDYIIICNNDIVFDDDCFLQKADALYKKYNYDVLGPDILDIYGNHTSPLYERMLSIKEIDKIIFSLKHEKIINIVSELRNKFINNKEEKQRELPSFSDECVVLGPCFIYSKKYINDYDDAFYNDTFLFGEELLLKYRMICGNRKMIYSNELSVVHEDGKTMRTVAGSNYESSNFYKKNCIESLSKLKRLMKNKKSI